MPVSLKSSQFHCFLSTQYKTITTVLQVLLAWLNIDFGVTTCFHRGIGAFGLQNVFLMYIWVISGVIIVLSNRFIPITRLNEVKVLATLFL